MDQKNKLQENSWYRARGATLNNWGEIGGSPFLADPKNPEKKQLHAVELWQSSEWLSGWLLNLQLQYAKKTCFDR